MKAHLSLYFFIIATIQLGLLLGLYHHYRSQSLIQPSRYWFASLLLSVCALYIFGAAVLVVEDVSKPAFNFTIANTFFYASAVLQSLFCRSLRGSVSNPIRVSAFFSIVCFSVIFEQLRQHASFEARTIFIVALLSFFYLWQILQVHGHRRAYSSDQLMYLQYVTALELLCGIGRVVVIVLGNLQITSVEQIPGLLVLFTMAQLVMNTLAYTAIAGYWSERISSANAMAIAQNEAAEKKLQEISNLLKERERLIFGLTKANRTAATGALSASIAHELNQPLGASSLHIQLLQMRLANGAISSERTKEILDALESDNKRAAAIVKSLRSIFADDESQTQQLLLSSVIKSVLEIVAPELKSKNIVLELLLHSDPVLQANPSELEQVVLNLINNAIDAIDLSSSKIGKISVQVDADGQAVRLSISDNGGGVPAQFQSELFELLTTTKDSGMGLGLWLCKHIVTRCRGRIWYEDLNGEGAKFVLELPTIKVSHAPV
ncbi:MAG: hypothetical protein RLY91_867 [Pseudomonadota bacterium]|jgi:signal transduction histidine kinase